MKKLFVPILLLIGCATAQAGFMDDVDKLVTGSQQIGEQLPSAGGEAAPQSRHAGPSVNEDQHYLQSDDYFISEQPLQGNEWIYVKLAKMTTKPTAASKGEAEFFKVGDGNKLWTRHFWRTHAAQAEQMRLGTVVVMFEGHQVVDVYQQPENKESARRDAWFMARVTDTSDLYKGYVTVSGGYKVGVQNLRVPVGGR